ncbi:MAG: tetratricopeptide repeat-containing sensor histidine kinase [Chlorobiales bacterium]
MVKTAESIVQQVQDLIQRATLSETVSARERRDALKACEEAIRLATIENDDIGKANALKLKGIHHIHLSEYKEALEAFLQEEKIRRQLSDELALADAIHNVANAYHYLNNLQKAMMLYLEAMQKFERLQEHRRLRSVYNSIGWLHFKIGNYAESLDYYLKCQKLAEETNDKADLAQALNAVGTVYQKVGELEHALEFYFKSLKLSEEVSSPKGIGMAYGNIGIVYHEMKRYEEALEAHYQSKRIFEEINHTYHLAAALGSIAADYEAMNMENEALFFYEESLKAAKKSSNVQVEVEVLQKRAGLLLKRNENEDALHLLRNALRIGKKAQLKSVLFRVYRLMVMAYRALGDFESALSAYESFYELEKELFNEESNRKIRNMQLAFELEQGKREMELTKQKNADLRRLNAELSEANRLKTELLGIAAHDLKNPLQLIFGFAELIGERTNDDFVQQYAQRIRAASERMLEMITLLLQDAAISQGKIALSISEVNVSELCESVIEFYRARAEEKSQVLNSQIEPNCIVPADRQYLFQIIENLLSNAIKYSEREKNITLSLRRVASEGVIEIAVRDEGQGLTKEDLSKLFGKFQRLSAKPTGNESSTGLGLSIVKELVELHHGKIWAESEGKNKGTTFFVQLPIFQNVSQNT